MSIIKGIHHISMKTCNEDEYEKVVDFYTNILRLEIARTWEHGIMFDTGSGLIEIFKNGEYQPSKGIIRHLAFAVDDVDVCVQKVKEAGYEVFKGPTDIEIPSNPVFPARMAFCYGPLGEEVEFFQER